MDTGTQTRKPKRRNAISADKARECLGSLITRAATSKTERVVLTRHGVPTAALVSIDDLNALEAGEAA